MHYKKFMRVLSHTMLFTFIKLCFTTENDPLISSDENTVIERLRFFESSKIASDGIERETEARGGKHYILHVENEFNNEIDVFYEFFLINKDNFNVKTFRIIEVTIFEMSEKSEFLHIMTKVFERYKSNKDNSKIIYKDSNETISSYNLPTEKFEENLKEKYRIFLNDTRISLFRKIINFLTNKDLQTNGEYLMKFFFIVKNEYEDYDAKHLTDYFYSYIMACNMKFPIKYIVFSSNNFNIHELKKFMKSLSEKENKCLHRQMILEDKIGVEII